MTPSTAERFTVTVAEYLKYRPSYPKEVLQLLVDSCGLTPDSRIADVGSGTGLLSKLLLDNGNSVYGVEPNPSMREAAGQYLKDYAKFHSVNGTAEATTLENQSVDFVTVGTAFHWFDMEKTKLEFQRILKKSCWVLLVWNVRNTENSPLLLDYENLILKYVAEYKTVNAKKVNKEAIEKFFSPYEMHTKVFKNTQRFNWEGLKGRILSSSYCLRSGDAEYENMMQELKAIFERYQKESEVEFMYDTKVYLSQMSFSDL